jgi:hypothetical protein
MRQKPFHRETFEGLDKRSRLHAARSRALTAVPLAYQFAPGTCLMAGCWRSLRSIWLNEVGARRIRRGGGLVETEQL